MSPIRAPRRQPRGAAVEALPTTSYGVSATPHDASRHTPGAAAAIWCAVSAQVVSCTSSVDPESVRELSGSILLATFTLSWIAAVIRLLGTSVEVTQQVAALVIIPVFLSNALVPTGTMPAWLRVIAANQPLSQAIDCIRALLAGTPLGDHLGLEDLPGAHHQFADTVGGHVVEVELDGG